MKFQNKNISKQKVLHAFLSTSPKLFDMLMPFFLIFE